MTECNQHSGHNKQTKKLNIPALLSSLLLLRNNKFVFRILLRANERKVIDVNKFLFWWAYFRAILYAQ